jgi:hypothetical protein
MHSEAHVTAAEENDQHDYDQQDPDQAVPPAAVVAAAVTVEAATAAENQHQNDKEEKQAHGATNAPGDEAFHTAPTAQIVARAIARLADCDGDVSLSHAFSVELAMSESDFGRWQDMTSAPRDGTKVLVEIRASEQGPAEVDMVRWAKPDRSSEACWVSTDSDPAFPVVYADAELISWMPLPAPLPKLRSTRVAASASAPAREGETDETGGSGI